MNEQRKKKVLFLITKSNFGGAQRYVYDLATNLPTEQYEVVVALGGNGPLTEKLEAAGLKVLSIPALQRDISIIKELQALWQIGSLIKDEDPDIFHINSSKAGLLGVMMGRILGVPRIIFTAHGWAFNENRNALSRIVLKLFHWLTVIGSHQTIAVSHTLKSQLAWLGAERKMTVVYNGRAAATLQSKDRSRRVLMGYAPELEQYQDDFWSITIGELHPVKQHNVAIEAMAKLAADKLPIRHLIISDGDERNNLQALIATHGLATHVFLLGAIDEAAQYLKAADVFVLPSRSEGFPYVPIEACQAGVPVIASNVGGIPEIITDKVEGLLIPSGDSEALAQAIAELYHDTAQRAAYAAAALARGEVFSIAKMVGGTLAIYENDPTPPRFEAEAAM
ncbi:glycosyltransferase family 4 protein [Candidatus Kaiserbacteria bacterium]|nr:glycosyltransferase family 4 protein [Candidatus Kaiserbacteria bacterium]MCB9811662.1 glycosyltransferase family 4 protein [Candidatus Nomurabacteria bacterium]